MRPRFVLDASVNAGWIFADQADGYCGTVLASLAEGGCLAPALWALEMANVLLTAERRGKFSREDGERSVGALLRLPIEMVESEGRRCLESIRDLGRDFSLSAYDAVYLDLALREGLPLATRDRDLVAAMKAAGGSVYLA